MGSYEPTYRTRLAKLQFRIHNHDPRDYALIKDLSGYVAEITILLDPLQAQITIIQKWRQWYRQDVAQTSHLTNLFLEAISTREAHLNSLKRLQERARESQTLVGPTLPPHSLICSQNAPLASSFLTVHTPAAFPTQQHRDRAPTIQASQKDGPRSEPPSRTRRPSRPPKQSHPSLHPRHRRLPPLILFHLLLWYVQRTSSITPLLPPLY
jgi:hypothetical protein